MKDKLHNRDHSLDNARFLLIFLVVFAHLLREGEPFLGSRYIYKMIYTFHMPAFLFLFGYNIQFSPRRIVYRWCIPYAVFQTAYILFVNVILKKAANLQYTTPYWLLWYMMACIFYQLLLPLYDTADKRRQICVLLVVFVLSVLIGYENSVGYSMSLSRFFVFQPWFLLGYYCKKNGALDSLCAHKKLRLAVVIGAAVLICILAPLCMKAPIELLYGAYSYAKCGSSWLMRTAVSCTSFLWIVLLFVGIKSFLNKPVFLLTYIGQNTWPIFLLHGFIVKAAPIYCPYLLNAPWKIVLLSFAILLLFGNKLCVKAVCCISFSWLEKCFLHKTEPSPPATP